MAEETTIVQGDKSVFKREWVSRMRYVRSFAAKLILSDDKTKDFYATLVNKLLSYDKTRISKSRTGEGFYFGRAAYARIGISGKTLCLYLALDPSLYSWGRYKLTDVSGKKKYAHVPGKLKIKSARALKYALKLVDILAEERAFRPRKKPIEEVKASDYPFEPFETLLARDLIRIIRPRLPQEQSPETPEEESAVEPVVESAANTQTVKRKPGDAAWVSKLRYSRSFLAKLILSDKRIKEYYAAIATKLLSYDKVKSRLSWSGISFTRGRATLAKVTFAGKTLKINLATDPNKHQTGRYKMKDDGGKKKYAQVPASVKVRSDGATRFVLSVIDEIAGDMSLALRDPAMTPIRAKDFPYDTFNNLLARGLIRLLVAEKKPPKYVKGGPDVPTGAAVPGEDGYPVLGAEGEKAGEGAGVVPGEGEGEGLAVKPTEEEGVAVSPTEGAGEGVGTGEETGEGSGEGTGAGEGTGEGTGEGEGTGPAAAVAEGEGSGEGGTAAVAKEVEEYGAMKISDDAYQDTLLTMDALIGRHEEYDTILNVLKNGNPRIKMSKKFLLKMIDETWVKAIEDSLQALDEVVRNPGHFIEETEELLPIERTKKVTSRSIQHLCQHTDLISSVDGDTIIPSKLLNVFREDSMMTYENKFINTLLSRLYIFVTRRYDAAVKNGANEKVTSLEFEDEFLHGTLMGKIHLSIELSGTYKNGREVKNYAFNTDLWKRVKKLYEVARTYQGSEFVLAMGKASIRPPVMRTNAILKNKYLRQCLALWEFIESYDDAGYGIMVDEQEENLSEEYIKQVYQGVAEQYLIYCRHMAEAKALETPENFVPPQSLHFAEPEKVKPIFDFTPTAERKQEEAPESDEEIAIAIEAALAAEQILDERSEEERRKAEEERKRIEAEAAKAEEEARRKEEEEAERRRTEAAAAMSAEVKKPVSEDESAYDENRSDEEDESDEVEITTEDEESITRTIIRYKKSFVAKVKLLGDPLREYYCAIYNKFMTKNKVTARTSFSGVTFTTGRKQLAKVAIAGKTLKLYLALDPATVPQKYFVKDSSSVKKYAAVPALLKVKSGRALKNALELIEETCVGLQEATKQEFISPSDFGYETIDQLVAMGLATKEVTTVTIAKEKPPVAPKAEETGYVEKEDILARTKSTLAQDEERVEAEETQEDPNVIGLTKRQKEELRKALLETPKEEERPEEPKEEIAIEPETDAPQTRIEAEKPEEPEKPKKDLSGAGGDALLVKKEALEITQGIILELPEEEEPPVAPVEPERPKEEVIGGDALLPKPITLDALNDIDMQEADEYVMPAPQTTEKKGLLSRLFRRRK